MPEPLTLTLSPTLERALIYVAVAAATLVAFANWRRSETRSFREPLIAFFGLWFVQGAVFVTLAAPDRVPASIVRGLDLASIVLLAWGFLASSLPGYRTGALLGIGLTLAAALTAFSLSITRMTGAEPGWMAALWSLGTLGVAAGAALLLVTRRPPERTSASIGAFAALAAYAALDALAVTDLAGVCRVIAFWLLPVGLYQRAIGELRGARETLREFSQVALAQTQELVTLLEASTHLFTSFEVDELLPHVIDGLSAGIEFDRALIALSDPTSPQTLRVVCAYPRGLIARDETFLIPSQPAIASALSRGEQTTLGPRGQGASPLARLLNNDPPGETLLQTLTTQDDTIGVFVIARGQGRDAFEDREKRMIEALGAQIAAAFTSAHLYHSLDLQARELARVLAQRDDEITRHTATLESMADGVVVADRLDRVIAVNAAAARLLDTPRDQLLNRSFGAIFERMKPLGDGPQPGVKPPAATDSIRATFQFGERVLQAGITPAHNLLGDRLGLVAVFRDITQERHAEQGRIQFIGSIAQELRAPLTTIRGYADLLAKGAAGALSPAALGFVETIRASSERLSAQVKAILQFNEFDRGRIELAIEEVDVASILAEIADEHRARLQARGLSLELNVKPNLPTVRADRARVRQVLDQLIDNARKFTPSGGTLRLSAAPSWNGLTLSRPADVAVTVEDNGRGFDPHDSERLFQRFYRAQDAEPSDPPGLGIGLTVARGICEAMGGHLWGTGQKDRGAKFTLILPVARVAEPPVEETTSEDLSIEAWIERTLSRLDEDDRTTL